MFDLKRVSTDKAMTNDPKWFVRSLYNSWQLTQPALVWSLWNRVKSSVNLCFVHQSTWWTWQIQGFVQLVCKNGSRCIWLYTWSTFDCSCPHTKCLIHGPPYWMVSIWSIEIYSTALVTWYTLPSLTRAKIVPAVSQHAAPLRLLLICIAFCGMSF